MRQSNGTDILGVNDPRSVTIGILYVAPDDERASVLAAILTQQKLARQVIVVVLPAQNKAFQRPIDFDGLKNMRRTMKAQLILIAPQGSSPAEFSRQRRFATFSSLDDYAQSLWTGQQAIQPAKRGWPFGRKLQLRRTESPPALHAPSLPVPPAMMMPSSHQPSSPAHVDVAVPPAQVPNMKDAVSDKLQQLPTVDEDVAHHTDDITQPQSMVAHTDEQLTVAAPSSIFRTQLRIARRRWLFALLILLLLLVVGGGIYTAFSVFGTEVTATVTITPVRETLQHTYSIAAVPGVPSTVQSQVEARFLSSTPPAQSGTMAASGHGTLPATPAKGTLTFYNSLPTAQTLPANTLITDAKGIEVVTDTPVVLPAAKLPVEGSAIVAAHTINTGISSNIPANDLTNVQCCADGISVMNPTAFTGGQNQLMYSYIEQSDIDGAISQLTGTLTQRAQDGVMGQMLPGEHLIGSIGCVPGVTTNHSAGERAANVTVTITETCSGEVYNQQQAHAAAGDLLTATALKNFGASYALVGNVTTTIIRAMSVNPAGKVAVLVKAGGVWAYQFSDTQKSQLAHLITGKSEKDAVAALATTAGVHSVNVQVNGGDGNTLPTDTRQIIIVVKT